MQLHWQKNISTKVDENLKLPEGAEGAMLNGIILIHPYIKD